MHYGQLLQEAIADLKSVGVEDAEIDCRLLLESISKQSRTQLYLNVAETVDDKVAKQYREVIDRRKRHEPLAYILCEQEFYGYPFYVSPAVLIPRSETELLVEAVLTRSAVVNRKRILEVCTGSGAIAITLALQLRKNKSREGDADFFICASDISEAALMVAKRNACRHLLSSEDISFRYSDLLSIFAPKSFSLVVANPPYICNTELKNLMPEVRDFEPHLALAGGDDGLLLIRKIEYQLQKVLVPGGDFFMEFGAGQGPAVRKIFSGQHWQYQKIIKDYAGLERILWAKRSEIWQY